MTEGGHHTYTPRPFVLDKRTTGWWGGRFSYTFSKTEDNQFGEASIFQNRTALPQNNYDLDAEYGVSNFDSPHRIILAPIFKLPNSSSDSGVAKWLLNGWNASAVVELVSGSPLECGPTAPAPQSANLGLFGGRQRPNLTGDPNTDGSNTNRVILRGQSESARYFDQRRLLESGVGALGDAPRTIGDARYQFGGTSTSCSPRTPSVSAVRSAQVRFEILNLTNTPKFRGIDSNCDPLITFGRITQQAGFMRIWQLSFRYTFWSEGNGSG